MLKRYCLSFLFCCFLFLWLACSKDKPDKCFKSTGKIISEAREISAFKCIELHDDIHMIIIQDKEYKATVEGGDNLLPYVSTEVENEILIIKNNNKCDWLRSYKNKITVTVYMPEIAHIDFHGSGTITGTDTLTANLFETHLYGAGGSINLSINTIAFRGIVHSGVGDITLKGKTSSAFFYIHADGARVVSDELISDSTRVITHSPGDSRVYAKNILDVEIYYLGSVYCKGNPQKVNQKILGEGKLIAY